MNATHLRFRDLWKSLWLFFAVFAKAGSRGELANPQGHWFHMACLLPSPLQPHHCASLTLNPQSLLYFPVFRSPPPIPLCCHPLNSARWPSESSWKRKALWLLHSWSMSNQWKGILYPKSGSAVISLITAPSFCFHRLVATSWQALSGHH